jgi:hypothetical protein
MFISVCKIRCNPNNTLWKSETIKMAYMKTLVNPYVRGTLKPFWEAFWDAGGDVRTFWSTCPCACGPFPHPQLTHFACYATVTLAPIDRNPNHQNRRRIRWTSDASKSTSSNGYAPAGRTHSETIPYSVLLGVWEGAFCSRRRGRPFQIKAENSVAGTKWRHQISWVTGSSRS